MDKDDVEDIPAEEEFGCRVPNVERIGPGVAAKACDDHGHGKTKDDPGKKLQEYKCDSAMMTTVRG